MGYLFEPPDHIIDIGRDPFQWVEAIEPNRRVVVGTQPDGS